MLAQDGQGFFLGQDTAAAFGVLQAILRAVAQMHTAGPGPLEQVRCGLAAQGKHLPGQMADLVLGVAAAADGEPVQQGMGVHADDGLELRGLGLEVAQVFFRQSGFQPGVVPLAGQVGQVPAGQTGRVPVRQGHLGTEVTHAGGIDHGKTPFAAQLRTTGLDEVGSQALAHQLGLGHAGIAFHAEKEKVEFQRGAMPAFQDIAHDLPGIGRGHYLTAHETRRDVRVDLAAPGQQHHFAVPGIFFIQHVRLL